MDQLSFSLLLVTDSRLAEGRLVDTVDECLESGLPAVQLREKDMPVAELLTLAGRLREATRRHGAMLFINDRADVALAVEADGVQRTHRSLPVEAMRAVVGSRHLIGASVHSVEEALAAEAEGADFVIFGPVYDTPSKRVYGPPQGLPALAKVASSVRVPVLAVGGMTPWRVEEVRGCGARGVAVISAILDAERPAEATRAFLHALTGA